MVRVAPFPALAKREKLGGGGLGQSNAWVAPSRIIRVLLNPY
ncbi:MAG: hypothetical protein RLZZ344_369, partial [Pseudomonadota bacterium]